MAKKIIHYRVSCAVAVLAAIAFIVACGEGDVIDIENGTYKQVLDDAQDNLEQYYMNSEDFIQSLIRSSSSEEEPDLSSDSGESSSSEGEPDLSSDSGESSSSEEAYSSSLPSSASEPSSSSQSPYTLTCEIAEGLQVTEGSPVTSFALASIQVKCVTNATGTVTSLDATNDVFWGGLWTPFSWLSPKAGTYSNVTVEVPNGSPKGVCLNLTASCSGTLVVQPKGTTPSSSSTVIIASSSSVVTPSSSSTVIASSSSRASSSSAVIASSSSRASSSSAVTPSSSSATGAGNYCDWNKGSGPGNCWPIKDESERTNCQQNGLVVHECPGAGECKATSNIGKYCDYGPPSQYGDGGCWKISNQGDLDNCCNDGGSVVEQSNCTGEVKN